MISRVNNTYVKLLGGVCAGVAYEYSIPVGSIRLAFLLLGIITGAIPLILIYLTAWLLLPTISVTQEEFNEKTRPKKLGEIYFKERENKKENSSNVNYNNLYSEVEKEKVIEKEKNQ